VKRYVALAVLLLAGTAGVVSIQRGHVDTRPSPEALLTAAADAQHELTRVPARFDRMTDADEITLGKKMAAEVPTYLGSTDADSTHDGAMQDYVQRVGERVAVHARRRLPWTFHYIPSPDFVNAFALPGGEVFVGEGLIRLMGSEDALAAVLGHEIEHIDLGHCAERAQVEARTRQVGVLGDVVALSTEIFMAGYSKEQESEADSNGIALAVAAGYSYTGILQFFENFTRRETGAADTARESGGPINEATQLSAATLSGYLASHPPSRQRSESIRELARERGWPVQPLKRIR
jgi:predicted Zn-dependent protease